MERLHEKLIGGYEVTRDDRSTKVKETDVWLFISLSVIGKDLKGCDTEGVKKTAALISSVSYTARTKGCLSLLP